MEPPSSRYVTVVNDTSQRVHSGPLKRTMALALACHGLPNARVCLLLTSDYRIRELNRAFRGIDAPTDVLTFASGDLPPNPIGDIAIALPYAERQAARRGVSLEQELSYLAIHGALHLAGLDDETDHDRESMILAMNRIASLAGIPEDYDWYSVLHEDPSEEGTS